MLSGEATNTNFIPFDLTQWGRDPTIYCTRWSHYKPTSIVSDITHHRQIKPVGIKRGEIDIINFFSNIFRSKSVKSNIPPYFRDQTVTIISCTYNKHIVVKIFNYKNVMQYLRIDVFKSKHLDWICAGPLS